MSDPFEHLEDQLLSYELLESHRKLLAEDARELLSEQPGVDPVGLILEAGASEARPFIEALETATGQKLNVPGFVGVAPRAFVLHILRTNCPAGLDNLPAGDVGAVLPVLVATKNGFRFDEVDYRPAD